MFGEGGVFRRNKMLREGAEVQKLNDVHEMWCFTERFLLKTANTSISRRAGGQ